MCAALLQNSMYVIYVCMYMHIRMYVMYVCVCVCVCVCVYVCMCLYSRTRLKGHRNVKHLVYNARYAVVSIFSSLSTITLCSSVITTPVYRPIHNVIIELDCVYIFSNIFSCETNKSYMKTRLYNDVGAKCVNDPKYYLVAVTVWNFQIDIFNC